MNGYFSKIFNFSSKKVQPVDYKAGSLNASNGGEIEFFNNDEPLSEVSDIFSKTQFNMKMTGRKLKGE